MAEIEAERRIDAGADEVFALVADPSRLPEWLPTVSSAQRSGPGTVDVEGTAHGRSYDDSGFWRAQPDQLRVEWGEPSRGGEPSQYAGWLQVAHSDRGDGEACSVTVHLSFLGGRGDDHVGPPADEAQVALDTALRQLGELVQG